MALVTQIADALVAKLSTATFLSGATINRAYIPGLKPEQVSGLTIDVITSRIQTGRGNTRGEIAYRPTLWVCVMKPIDQANEVASTDALVDLVEQCVVYLYHADLTINASVSAVEFEQVFDPGLLDAGVFQSVLAVEILTSLSLT